MPAQHAASPPSTQPADRFLPRDAKAPTVIVDGYGASVQVDRGHLHISDGIGPARREIQLNRATNTTRRILLLATTGDVTLSALQWCNNLGIQVAMIDRDGNVSVLTSTDTSDDARLRRAQALAPTTDRGIQVSRFLLGRKLHGQRDVLGRLGYEIQTVEQACENIERAPSIETCRTLEAQAAASYWNALSQIECKFIERDQHAIPNHWMTAGTRHTRRTKSPRSAITPFNAILNYCYRLAEIETTIALRTLGLDPGIGIIHTDKPNRDSMALDCLEAIRPGIDSYVIELLSTRQFARKDFIELPTGICRILPPLSHQLAASMQAWRSAIEPIVEHTANMLRPANTLGQREAPTRLTRQNARAAQATIRKRVRIAV